jgi:hypothetical protein
VVAQEEGEVDLPARPTLHVPYTWPVFVPRLKREVTETIFKGAITVMKPRILSHHTQ